MTDIIATLIAPDADRDEVKAIVETLSSRAIGMFDTPLSADGALPATHWASSGHVDAQLVTLLTNPALLSATCSYLGYALTLERATEILSAVIYDTEGRDPYIIFAENDITLANV